MLPTLGDMEEHVAKWLAMPVANTWRWILRHRTTPNQRALLPSPSRGMLMLGSIFIISWNYDSGVSLGFDIRDFSPLHRSAFDVAGDVLEGWCKSWMGDDYSTPLEPEGWFEEGHQPGVHIWAPPPAAALIVLKKMVKAQSSATVPLAG